MKKGTRNKDLMEERFGVKRKVGTTGAGVVVSGRGKDFQTRT